jgi:hypothetical protein
MTPGQNAMPGALNQLFGGMNKLGGVLFDEFIRKRQEQQELALIEDMQGLQQRWDAFSDSFRRDNQGKNALNAEEAAAGFFEKEISQLNEKWAGVDRGLAYIKKKAGDMAASGVNAMRDYGNKQQDVYRLAETKTQLLLAQKKFEDPSSSEEERASSFFEWAKMNSYNNAKAGMPPEKALLENEEAYRKLKAARLERSFMDNYNNEDIGGARAALDVMKHGDAADFSAQYESGLSGSAAIGYDERGGTSYGKFQISSKAGTFDKWLKWLEKNGHEGVAQELRKSGPPDTGSREGKTPKVWRDMARSGAITDDMQLQFINESHIAPALEALPEKAREAILADGALYRAFFSTAVQHGANGAAKLISRNWNKSGGDREAFLDSLYADRKSQFGSSTDGVQSSVASRFERERAALGSSLVSPEKVARYEKMLQSATREKLKTDSISQLSEQFPDNPDKAALTALQNPFLAKDPQIQRSVVGYFDWLAGQQESAKKQAQLEQLNQSYEAIRNAAGKRDIPQINGIIIGAAPENMAKLESFAKRIMNGDGPISDPVAFDDMIARINEGQPVQIDAEYGNVLSLNDLRRGKDMIARRDMAQYRVQERAAFDEEALKYQPKISDKDRSALFRQFEASIPDGGYKDPAQRQKALTAFWRKITVDKPWSISKDIYGFQEKEFAAEGYYPSKGAEYQQLVEMAKAGIKARNGVEREPTEGELIRLYQQLQGVSEGEKK